MILFLAGMQNISEQYYEVMASYGSEVPPVPEIVPGTRGR